MNGGSRREGHQQQQGQPDEDMSNRRHVHHGKQSGDGTPHGQY